MPARCPTSLILCKPHRPVDRRRGVAAGSVFEGQSRLFLLAAASASVQGGGHTGEARRWRRHAIRCRSGVLHDASRNRPTTSVRVPTPGDAGVRIGTAGPAGDVCRCPGSTPTPPAPVHRGECAAVVVAAHSDRRLGAMPGAADRGAGHPHPRHEDSAQPRRHHAGDRHVAVHAGNRCRAHPAQRRRAGRQPVRQSADPGHQSRTCRFRGNPVPPGAPAPAAPGDH